MSELWDDLLCERWFRLILAAEAGFVALMVALP